MKRSRKRTTSKEKPEQDQGTSYHFFDFRFIVACDEIVKGGSMSSECDLAGSRIWIAPAFGLNV
jgi:hypothetical protein